MMRVLKWAAFAIFLTGSLALADITGGGGPGFPGIPANGAVGGVTTANLVCDGATDNAAVLQAALTAAATKPANTVYIPPASTACMFASGVTVPDKVNLWASPGSVILKAKTGNVSSPVLLGFSSNPTGNNIWGLTLDGGGTTFANTNNVVTAFNSNGVVLDHVTIQNTAGIGFLLSTTMTNSGMRDSILSNVGASYTATFNGTTVGTTLTVNSGLTGTIFPGQSLGGSGIVAGTTVVSNITGGSANGSTWLISISQSAGPESMTGTLEKQGIAFCCGVNLDTSGGLSTTTSGISGTTLTTGNSVSGIIGQYVYGVSVAPDTKVVSGSGTSWVVSVSQTVTAQHLTAALNQGNFVTGVNITNTGLDSISYTQQHTFNARGNTIVGPGIGGAGIYDHSNDASIEMGNSVLGSSTSGNCIDVASTSNVTLTNNVGKGCGGSGISYAIASHATIVGNIMVNNGQNGLTGAGASDAGLFLTGTTAPVSYVTVSGNDFSDLQTTPTQQYGIEMQTGSTFSHIIIDPNNTATGNVVGQFVPGGLLTNFSNLGATTITTYTSTNAAVTPPQNYAMIRFLIMGQGGCGGGGVPVAAGASVSGGSGGGGALVLDTGWIPATTVSGAYTPTIATKCTAAAAGASGAVGANASVAMTGLPGGTITAYGGGGGALGISSGASGGGAGAGTANPGGSATTGTGATGGAFGGAGGGSGAQGVNVTTPYGGSGGGGGIDTAAAGSLPGYQEYGGGGSGGAAGGGCSSGTAEAGGNALSPIRNNTNDVVGGAGGTTGGNGNTGLAWGAYGAAIAGGGGGSGGGATTTTSATAGNGGTGGVGGGGGGGGGSPCGTTTVGGAGGAGGAAQIIVMTQ